MRRILVIICSVAIHSFLRSQIGMQTNLPKAVALNSEVTFDVKIKKGNTANYAKYQLEAPREVSIKEVESRSGSFTTEDNIIKIIWAMVPQEEEVTITLKLLTGIVPGKKVFTQKYFYVEKDDKKQVEMEPVSCMVQDSAATGPYVSSSEFIEIAAKAMPSLLTTTINAAEIGTKNPALLIQQVLQLKKDSRDAYAVGEREKKKAEQKMAEAEAAMKSADAITDETEKKAAQEKAAQAKQKAENDLEVAERVLTLAKSLENNANEIDAINRSVNPDSYSADPKIAAGNGRKTNLDSGAKENSKEVDGSGTTEETPASGKKSKDKEKDKEVENGLVYKIQLGAFSKEPSKRDFKAVGKVKIAEENGMYKVLYGSFSTKEDALKQREQIIAKGFDGFVVAYENGIRVFK